MKTITLRGLLPAADLLLQQPINPATSTCEVTGCAKAVVFVLCITHPHKI